MKTLLLIMLSTVMSYGQVIKATISLKNGQFINNAPTGRDWVGWDVTGIKTYETKSDTSYFSNVRDQGQVTYYGTWARGVVGGGCECSFSNKANDSLVFMFTDAKYFEWRGELMSHHGIAKVFFDNIYIGEVNTYDTRNLKQTRNWSRDNLDPAKVYKFKLVVTGTKSTLSTGTYIVNHGFRLIKPTPVVVVPPPVVVVPPPVVVVPPPVVVVPPVETFQYTITRKGMYQVYVDGVLLTGEHATQEKAYERAMSILGSDRTKKVAEIRGPSWTITLKRTP